MAAHAQAERHRKEELALAQSDHELSVSRERERARQQHAVIDQMARDFAERKRKAVADYFSGVLTVQRYPSDFPTGVKIAYLPPGRELRIDIDLPLMTAIPELESAEYLITKKELKYKKLTAAARNKLYQQVVAQLALRTLRCVFAADREGLVLEAACNGYVDTIDTATGQDAHWCLVTVQVPRAEFERLDLARVDPMDCLAYLHAKISKTPEKYQPVQPIIEYPWDDLHYAEELDAAAGLDSVRNLLDLDGYEFEQLLVKLCQEIPEFDEVRRTRSRADGGIDLVAVNKTPFVGGRVAIQAKRYAPHGAAPGTGPGRMRGTGAHHPRILRHIDRGDPLMDPLVLLVVDYLRSAHRGHLLVLACGITASCPGVTVGGHQARNTDRRAQGNNVRPSGHDPSATLRSGFAFQEEPASRAARPHCPIPHGGTSAGPDAAAAPARPDPHRPAFSRSATIPK